VDASVDAGRVVDAHDLHGNGGDPGPYVHPVHRVQGAGDHAVNRLLAIGVVILATLLLCFVRVDVDGSYVSVDSPWLEVMWHRGPFPSVSLWRVQDFSKPGVRHTKRTCIWSWPDYDLEED
jgi:hypothetical protein